MEGTGESQQHSSLSSSSPSPSPSPPPPPPPPSPSIGIGLGSGATTTAGGKKRRKKLPSPKEMVAHYESQGMHTQEASLKVIEDLQNLLFRVVTTTSKQHPPPHLNSRLLRLESKLDSKPGYAQTLAIGITSGAVLRVFPQVAASLAHIWNSVRASTSTPNS